MEEIPEEFGGDESFETYFSASERASFTAEEEARYIDDMVTQRDIDNSRRQAEARAREEGLEEGALQANLETAETMKKDNFSVEMICRITGLSRD